MAQPKPSNSESLGRETATMHAARLPQASDFAELRGTYATPPPHSLPTEGSRSTAPGRVVDAVDHTTGFALPPMREPLSYADPAHPHHPLFKELRQKLPTDVSDEKVAELTLAARQGGVRPNRVESVHLLENGDAWVLGTIPGFDGMVNLRTPAPPLAETMQKAETFEQQHQAQVAQWQEQRQSQSHGRSM